MLTVENIVDVMNMEYQRQETTYPSDFVISSALDNLKSKEEIERFVHAYVRMHHGRVSFGMAMTGGCVSEEEIMSGNRASICDYLEKRIEDERIREIWKPVLDSLREK